MSKKTIKYLVLVGLLLVANLWLFFTEKGTKNRSFDDSLFTLQDTSLVSQIIMDNESGQVKLSKENDGSWLLNSKLKPDDYFRMVLLSAMNKVKVFRKIGKWDKESGKVRINYDGGELAFGYATNSTRTKSYFIKNGEAYEVGVPGYRDQIVTLFQLKEDQWRNRLLFNGSWRTIQKFNIKYPKSEELSIQFKNDFFTVNGKTNLDSTKLVNYLNQFDYFQANEVLSKGRMPRLDSLSQTSDYLAELKISDIQLKEPKHFYIYPSLKGTRYHLVKNEKGEMAVLDSRRVQSILKKEADFTLN